MPRGDKSKYADKLKRQAEHIEEGVEADEEYHKIAEARLLAYGRPDPVARPAPANLRLNDIVQGDCSDLIPLLPGRSVNLVLTSPPYGEQRSGLYPGIPDHQ